MHTSYNRQENVSKKKKKSHNQNKRKLHSCKVFLNEKKTGEKKLKLLLSFTEVSLCTSQI